MSCADSALCQPTDSDQLAYRIPNVFGLLTACRTQHPEPQLAHTSMAHEYAMPPILPNMLMYSYSQAREQ